MQVMLGASSIIPALQAQDWICSLDKTGALQVLETWIREKEAIWGECCVFIEVSFPEGKPTKHIMNNQIDLLICFPDRLAVLELKRHRKYAHLRLGDIIHQIDGQVIWMKRLLFAGPYPYPFPEKRIASFLFVPNLDLDDIRQLARDLFQNHSAWQVWPVGTRNELVGQCEREGRWLHLRDALDKQLGKHGPEHFKCGFHEFLVKKLKNAGATFRPFESLASTSAYLSTLPPDPLMLPDQWYVPGMRLPELARAKEILRTERIVEILGAQGAGKSTFANELLQAGDSVVQVSLEKCDSVQAIYRCVNNRFRPEMSAGLGDDAFLQQLCREPHVYWINRYDRTTAQFLASLLHAVHGLRSSADQFPARWMVESRMALGLADGCTCELTPLPNDAVSQILTRIQPGGAFKDPEQVVHMAQGNPGQAISLWRSKKPGHHGPIGSFSWFRDELSPLESRLLPLLCLAASKSPLGISCNAVSRWGAAVHGFSLTEVQEAVQTLLSELTRQQWVEVTKLGKETLACLPGADLPDDFSLTVINRVAPAVIEESLQAIGQDDQKSWLRTFHDELCNSAEDDTLSGVTLALSSFDDLEPFFRSTFRFTQLGAVLDWIDRTDWRPPTKQVYLLRAMRVLSRLWNDASTDVLTELGTPQTANNLDRFAFEFVKARAFGIRPLDDTFDLSSWRRMTETENDPELQATLYASAAAALQRGTRCEKAREIWDMLRDLPVRFAQHRSAWALVTNRVIAFLNATKVRQKVVDDEHAYALIRQLSGELVMEGVRVENIQLICDALFYSVRSQELGQSRTSCADVLSHLDALRFVEETSLRKGMRLQILLTEGSVHRHFCRQDHVPWAEFGEHFKAGLLCYSRAFRSALAQGDVMHILNSVAYMIDFCMKALRFPDEMDARAVVRSRVPGVLADVHRIQADVACRIRGTEEKTIYGSICGSYPLVLYLDALSSANPTASSVDELRSCFGSMVTDVLELVRSKRVQDLTQSLKRIQRTLHWGETVDRTRNRELIAAVNADLSRLLSSIQWVARSRNQNLRKAWEKLSQLVSP